MYEDPKSKISQLEKILDAKEDRVSSKVKRHDLHEKNIIINDNWNDEALTDSKETQTDRDGQFASAPVGRKKMPAPLKIFIGSIVFFILALLVAAYRFLGGGNIVSGNNIEITVKAPISISGGDVVPFEIEIKNNNNVTLQGADLGINFPIGARQTDDTSLPAKRVQDFLGNILPGQSVKKNLSVVLFGEENEKKEIGITLEYKVAGSNSLFNKTKSVFILVSSSPVNVLVTGPAEINTNQSVDFTVEITSNSPTVIKNLLLRAEYPFNFSFKESSPQNFSQNNVWLIGDMEPGAKRVIKLSGTMNGQEGEERGFNFNVGTQSKSDGTAIETVFTSAFSSVTIRRPFVSADIFLNGEATSEYVSSAGSQIEALIKWQNNLPYEVSDLSIKVSINGNSVDKSSIRADDGYYQSYNNIVIFNKATNISMAKLDPGDTGESKFLFSSFGAETVTGAALINPVITLDVSVTGRRVDYNGGREDVLFSDSRKVKITSSPQLFAKALYYVGPFQNKGPIPPKAESETTYTVTWTITNPLNAVSGTRVSATLPPYVKWLSTVSPNREKVDYDAGTGQVIWSPGSVLAGAGTLSPAKEVSFQISFIPSVSQIGTVPNLISEAVLSARDNFTLTGVSDSFPSLTTRLNNDPYFSTEAETVIK